MAKCPKCKKNMEENKLEGSPFGHFKVFDCLNKKCLFCGIDRKIFE